MVTCLKSTTLGSVFQQLKIQNKTSNPTNKTTVGHFRSFNINSSQIIVKIFVKSTQLDVRLRVRFLRNQSRKHIQGSLKDRILVSEESKAVSPGGSSTSTASPGKDHAVCNSGRAPRIYSGFQRKPSKLAPSQGAGASPAHPTATCRDERPAHVLTSPGSGPRRVGLRGLARVRDVTIRGGPGLAGPGGARIPFKAGGAVGWGGGGAEAERAV